MNRLAEPPSFWRRHLREILAIALLTLAIHDVFGAHGFLAMRRTQKEIQGLRDQITRLNQENSQLSSQVKELKSDPQAIERIAREQMGLARPGEIIIKLPSPDKTADPGDPSNGSVKSH
jgi:cell division protein FtsB